MILFAWPVVLLALLAAGAPAQFTTGAEVGAPEPIAVAPDIDLLRTIAELAAPAPVARVVTWRGAVVDAQGEPVPGVDVYLYPDGPTLRALGREPRLHPEFYGLGVPDPAWLDEMPLSELPHVVTDGGGRFEIAMRLEPPRAGRFLGLHEAAKGPVLALAAEGLTTRLVHATEPAPSAAPEVDLGRIVVAPAGSVSGRIVDPDGSAVIGALVRVLRAHAAVGEAIPYVHESAVLADLQSAASDEDGRFAIGGLWSGSVTLLVSHPAHQTHIIDKAAVEAGRVSDLGEVELVQGSRLSGAVVDARGAPVAGALVAAVTHERVYYGLGCVVTAAEEGDDSLPTKLIAAFHDGVPSVRTDAQGRFALGTLEEGQLTILVLAPGHEPARVPNVMPSEQPLRIALEDEAALDLRVVAAGTGEPLPSALVRVMRRQTEGTREYDNSPETDVILPCLPLEPGRWRVTGAGRVRNEILVGAPGFLPVRRSVPGLAAGAEAAVEIALQPARSLAGQVTGPDGEPLPGAVVQLKGVESWGLLILEAHGDESGRFTFPTASPGTFGLVVKAPGFAPKLLSGFEVAVYAEPLALTLERGAQVELTFRDGRGLPIAGCAVTLRRLPITGPDVKATTFHRPVARTDSEGRCRWSDVPAGSYRIHSEEGAQREVELQPGQHVRIELVDEGRVLRGRVSRRGAAVAGASVTIRRLQSSRRIGTVQVRSASDGTFEAWIPKFRTLEVLVTAPPGAAEDGATSAMAVPTHPLTLDVEDIGDGPLDVELPTGSIEGRCLTADGTPCSGDVVRLVGGDETISVVTDAEGRFAFSHVAEGEWTLTLRLGGVHPTVERTVILPADGHLVVDLVLPE